MALYLLRTASAVAVVRAKNGHVAAETAGETFAEAEIIRLPEDGPAEVLWGVAPEAGEATAAPRRRGKRLDDPAEPAEPVEFLDGSTS